MSPLTTDKWVANVLEFHAIKYDSSNFGLENVKDHHHTLSLKNSFFKISIEHQNISIINFLLWRSLPEASLLFKYNTGPTWLEL